MIQRLFGLLIFLTVTVTPALTAVTGDINNDTKVDLADAIVALQICAGMSPSSVGLQLTADVNGDSTIGLPEAIYALQRTAGASVITSFSPASGPVGTLVTLTGTNLIGVTEVKFSDTSATSFTPVSATSVTATVPPGAISAAITVITPAGTATSSTSFTVTGSTGECPVSTPTEVFTDSDKPVTNRLQTWDLTTPWGYNKSGNVARDYPLVVIGCWNEGSHFTEDVRKKYPSFYLNFSSNCSSDTDGVTLANLIDAAIQANYRIDTKRIYLTGFSAGGSGSFKIVRGMLTKKKLFAGIVRVAGQSESVLADEAVANTSLWYHIGLNDSTQRIDVARVTYTNLKGHASNATAIESTKTDSVTGFNRTTKTLTKNGIEIVKKSEYVGMGHDPGPCYRDPALFDWLFSQSLACQ